MPLEKEKHVKLIYISPLSLISNAIRYSKATWDKSDTDGFTIGEKDLDLIKRVGFNMNHKSVLEQSTITYDLKCSTKCLLELERHRVGVSMTVTSSRYALDKVQIEFEPTGNPRVDAIIENYVKRIEYALEKDYGSNDELAMALPQAFYYTLQLSFNLRSLIEFLKLRLSGAAHKTIRKVAVGLCDELPHDWFELIMLDKVINKHYFGKYNDEYRKKQI